MLPLAFVAAFVLLVVSSAAAYLVGYAHGIRESTRILRRQLQTMRRTVQDASLRVEGK